LRGVYSIGWVGVWVVAALFVGMPVMLPAVAVETASLPGGATSVRETYGDWLVQCATQESRKTCTMQQEVKIKSGQRLLGIELRPAGAGAEGALVLPFGLALAKGASVQIDEGATLARFAFHTCIPAGCVAPVKLDAKALAGLRKGGALKIKVTPADEGAEPSQWAVSLAGFSTAFDRAGALMK
jgi:invasion protein IalB